MHRYLNFVTFQVYALVFSLPFCNYKKQKICLYWDTELVLFGLHYVVIVRFYCFWGKSGKTMGERADSCAAHSPDTAL